ncbi:MAG: single-stranded DNA-binding protein [Candidatus Fimenecus sp.]
MLNSVIIMGRLTADPELRTTQNGLSVTSFTVAVDRRFQKQGEEKQTDFISVVAWRQTADFVTRFFKKGQMIAVQGSLQVRNYEDKNGNKRTAYDVVADNVSFCGSKNEGGSFGAARQETAPAVSYQSADAGSFSVLPDDNSQGFPFAADDDEGLPF